MKYISLYQRINNIDVLNKENENLYEIEKYIDDENVEKIHEIYSKLRKNNIDVISINDKYYKAIDLLYIIDEIVEKNEKLIKYHYNYKNIIEKLKQFYNVENDDDVENLNKYFNINIKDVLDEKLEYNNNKYNIDYYSFHRKNLYNLKDDIIRNKFIEFNINFEYYIIEFDDINISSLDYFYNLYVRHTYSLIDGILENFIENTIINDDYNKELLEKYSIELYALLDDKYYDELYDEIYEIIFNDVLNDYYKENEIIYENKTLLINKTLLKQLNNENELYYYSYYYNEIKYDNNKIQEKILEILDDVELYYDVIEFVDEFIYENYTLLFDDYKRNQFNNEITSNTDFYFYVKYHHDINLKKDELITIY